MTEQKFLRALDFYKPKNNGAGAASQWSIGSKRDCVFLEMAGQTTSQDDIARFDWDKKIKFKLDTTDIGEILTVISGYSSGIGPLEKDGSKHKGLFHSSKSGNAVLKFSCMTDEEHGTRLYYIALSVKNAVTDVVKTVSHTLTEAEVIVLGVALRKIIEVILDW